MFSWGKLLTVLTIVAVTAITVAAVVATAGAAVAAVGAAAGAFATTMGATAATAAAVTSVATAGAALGVGAAIGTEVAIGISNVTEVVTDGYNPIRDDIMGGNQEAYDVLQVATSIACAGIVEVGVSNTAYCKTENHKNENSEIPPEANEVTNYVESHNGTPPQGYKGGKTYYNNPSNDGAQLLPQTTSYREYDIHPYAKGINRGSERVVIGNDGSAWYTKNHYKSFTRIK